MVSATNSTFSYPSLNTFSNILSLELEVWKNIKGYENQYQISNFGRVKRLKQTRKMSNQFKTWSQEFSELILQVNLDSKGYPSVRLTSPGKTFNIHRLVALHFLKTPSKELVELCKGIDRVIVNHIDGNPLNPNVLNLEWCTYSYNNLGGNSKRIAPKGIDNYCSILTEEAVLNILQLLRSKSKTQTELAEFYGVKPITISNIWTGRSWNHITKIPVKDRTYKSKIKSLLVSEKFIDID